MYQNSFIYFLIVFIVNLRNENYLLLLINFYLYKNQFKDKQKMGNYWTKSIPTGNNEPKEKLDFNKMNLFLNQNNPFC